MRSPDGYVRLHAEDGRHRLLHGRVSGRGVRPPDLHRRCDRDLDLEYHLRHEALPAPGTERELGLVMSRLHSVPLDPSRPMWEFYFIEGLQGGASACT